MITFEWDENKNEYNKKIFAPSLGNFVFDNILKENRLTGILKVYVDIKTYETNFEILPYYISKSYQPVRNKKVIQKLKNRNEKLHEILSCDEMGGKKINRKAFYISNLGHLKNRVIIRILFILNILDYRPYIFKILKKKLVSS